MYKVIDVNTWERKKQFTWFNSFTNPCYGFNVEIDVTEVLNYSHETKTSFFINYLFLMMKGLNETLEMRLRIVDGEVRLYDVIDPTYTIMTKTGIYENGEELYNAWFAGFYPCDNPKYSITILREAAISGSIDCCPIFKTIVDNLEFSD